MIQIADYLYNTSEAVELSEILQERKNKIISDVTYKHEKFLHRN